MMNEPIIVDKEIIMIHLEVRGFLLLLEERIHLYQGEVMDGQLMRRQN